MTTEKLSTFILVIQSSIENVKNMRGHFIIHGVLAKKSKKFWITIHMLLQRILKTHNMKKPEHFYWHLWTMN